MGAQAPHKRGPRTAHLLSLRGAAEGDTGAPGAQEATAAEAGTAQGCAPRVSGNSPEPAVTPPGAASWGERDARQVPQGKAERKVRRGLAPPAARADPRELGKPPRT